jgi:hypothetical protein
MGHAARIHEIIIRDSRKVENIKRARLLKKYNREGRKFGSTD